MNPQVRPVTAALALLIVAGAYFAYQGRMDRPGPPRPAASFSAARPTGPPMPPTAREILDRRAILDLRAEQIARLETLDQLWTREASGLEAMIRDAERQFSVFATEAQHQKGASLPEIQRRSAEFSQLSAELRERRRHHADVALGVLTEGQRQRLAQPRPPVVEERNDGATRR